MRFLGNIPNVFRNASVEAKQRLLRLVFESAIYDTEEQKLIVKFKPIFQALRIAKDNIKSSNKVTTLPKVGSERVLEYLNKNIELSLKRKVTTLKKLSIIEKETSNESLSKNGAPGGTRTHAYRNHNPRS